MLSYYFCRNTLSDMPIHTSLYTGSSLVVAIHSLHCSIHLSKYSTHVPYIQFIPLSVWHTLHQVLPNHFSSHTSLTFKCMKIWVRCFLTKFKLLSILAPQLSSDKQRLNHLIQVFCHRQWKHTITITHFLTITFLHLSPNTICEQLKKQQRVKKKKSHPTKFLKTNMEGNLGVLRRAHVQGKAKHTVALL